MHLISLALFWFWFRGRIVQVNMDTPLDVRHTHRGLAISGAIVALAGLVLAVLVSSNWDYLKGAVKITGAVQSGVVAGGRVPDRRRAVLCQPAGARLLVAGLTGEAPRHRRSPRTDVG